MNRILVVAVHPDDETLGCGGTLLRSGHKGDALFWCIVTSPFLENGFSEQFIDTRMEEIETVHNCYSFTERFELGFPATALDQVSHAKLVRSISEVINECSPDIIYLPFFGDVHTDHKITFQAAYSCTKTFRCRSLKKIYIMETLSETEFSLPIGGNIFVPNSFVDISPFFHKKIEIMQYYSSELADHPFPRSIDSLKALALFRGSLAGCKYAESFMLLREIRK